MITRTKSTKSGNKNNSVSPSKIALANNNKNNKSKSENDINKNLKKNKPVNKDELYYVEDILDKKIHNKIVYYKVKWDGYPLEECTWEPINELYNVQYLIDDFEKLHKQILDAKNAKRTKIIKKAKIAAIKSESEDDNEFIKQDRNSRRNFRGSHQKRISAESTKKEKPAKEYGIFTSTEITNSPDASDVMLSKSKSSYLTNQINESSPQSKILLMSYLFR